MYKNQLGTEHPQETPTEANIRSTARPFAFPKWLVVAALVTLAPLVVRGDYERSLLILCPIFALLAIGQDIVFGRAGQLMLCQAAFFGIGAYVSGLLTVQSHMSFWLAAPAGIAAATLSAMLVGISATRLSGHYLAIVTLAFGVVAQQVLLNWVALTRGAEGLGGIRRPSGVDFGGGMQINFQSDVAYLYLCGLALVGVIGLLQTQWCAQLVARMSAVREDELAARSLGIRTRRIKVTAFGCAGLCAGLAGVLYPPSQGLISPDAFSFLQSVTIVMMVVIGGSGTIAGPILGTVFLTFLPEWLRVADDYRWIVYGIGLILCIAFLPEGLTSGVNKIWTWGRSIWPKKLDRITHG